MEHIPETGGMVEKLQAYLSSSTSSSPTSCMALGKSFDLSESHL